MPDETPEAPEKKKRRRKVKPAVKSPEQRITREIEKAARALSMEERAIAHLGTEYGLDHAAKTMGWDIAAVKEVWNRAAVQRYLEKAEEIFLHKLASVKVRMLKKIDATPAHVQARLMDLAMLDPADTKGNIDGQVKALQVLSRILGMTEEGDPLKGKSADELKALIANAHGKIIEGSKPATQ